MEFRRVRLLAASLLLLSTCLGVVPNYAKAAVQNPVSAPRISFTFDDGLATTYNYAAPTLAKYGLTGTDYVITGCVGMTKVPNKCHANTATRYMTWAQVIALQNKYGWEIGSHTVTHPYLASKNAQDGQPNLLTNTQVINEIVNSKSALVSHGLNVTDFSTPYGDYNNFTLAQIAKVYASHRGFADQNNNDWPYSDYLINDFQVQAGVTVAQVKAKIDDAIANNRWLVLTMHNIKPTPSTNPDNYEYGVNQLDQIAAYVKAKQDAGMVKSVHINQGLVTSDTNLLANGTFDNGISGGWHTPNTAAITKDTNNNGSYPSPANSIKFVANSKDIRLYSPKVTVSSNSTYVLKSFLNVQAINSGDIEYYIDEYDANGNWISGQYKRAETNAFVEEMNFDYTPSSTLVASADLQITVLANSGITAYVDNAQWFPVATSTVNPTNLMTNAAFDNGIADGWRTDDPTNIVADGANNGSPNNPVNSVKMTAETSAGSTHLFSPTVPVDPTKSYSLTSYLNIKTITSGEVGLYIDEYDANGNWISGQYKQSITAAGAGDRSFIYTPSSNNVAKASLQVIVTGNSGISAYFDDVRWYQN